MASDSVLIMHVSLTVIVQKQELRTANIYGVKNEKEPAASGYDTGNNERNHREPLCMNINVFTCLMFTITMCA